MTVLQNAKLFIFFVILEDEGLAYGQINIYFSDLNIKDDMR